MDFRESQMLRTCSNKSEMLGHAKSESIFLYIQKHAMQKIGDIPELLKNKQENGITIEKSPKLQ